MDLILHGLGIALAAVFWFWVIAGAAEAVATINRRVGHRPYAPGRTTPRDRTPRPAWTGDFAPRAPGFRRAT